MPRSVSRREVEVVQAYIAALTDFEAAKAKLDSHQSALNAMFRDHIRNRLTEGALRFVIGPTLYTITVDGNGRDAQVRVIQQILNNVE